MEPSTTSLPQFVDFGEANVIADRGSPSLGLDQCAHSRANQYSLIIPFSNLTDLQSYIHLLEEFDEWKTKQKMKRENDRRGRHIAGLHVLAKQYKNDHPELSYRECLKAISKTSKE